MKKVLSIISAGLLAILAGSCVKDDLAKFDVSNATAPVLGSYEIGEKAITASYTPGKLGSGYTAYHSLALVNVGGQAVSKTLSTTDDGSTLSVSINNLSKALMFFGYTEGQTVSIELAVRTGLQNPSQDNGINGHVDSDAHISISNFEIVLPQGSPYEGYDDLSTWTVIGSLSQYAGADSWNGDLVMWTDGNGNHVAANVSLAAGDEFKLRKDADWGVNVGGTFGSLDSEFSVEQDGANITVGATGKFDIFFNETSNTVTISEAYDPYPEYTEASDWSIIGSIDYYGNSWNADLAMISDGTSHVALGVVIGASDEFKFRQGASWDVNLGGEFGGVDSEFSVAQDGPNIVVGADGVYDIFVNPGAGTATVATASGAKASYVAGGNEPEPVAVTGWNIIGLNGDWENDILATQEGNLWTAYITAEDATEFKWRKDGAWDENYGGTLVALGEPFAAEPGGGNIAIEAGFYKVVLDTEALTITVSDGNVWSLIGDFNSWGGDVDMTVSDGVWTSPATKLTTGGFKIRHNHDWALSVGGTLVSLGEPFEAVSDGGPNIIVPEDGTYIVVFDENKNEITVSAAGWGVVGSINSWGGTPDIPMKEDAEHSYLVAKNVSVTASDEIKIRYNNDWDAGDYGAATNVGHAVKADKGGANIKPGIDGAVDVYFFVRDEVILVVEAGAEPVYWGVVGTINSWNHPDYIMYENSDGDFIFEGLAITAKDQIKIRQNEAWVVDRGGNFGEVGTAFEVTQGGPNITVGREGTINVLYKPADETITITGELGDEADLPETMYMIGQDFGSWDWSSDGIVELTPVNGEKGAFWAIRNIAAGTGFKFCSVKEWSGDFTSLGEDSGYTVDGGNCFVEETGVYMIYVDVANKKLTIEKAQVYGIGDCFGGWNEAMEGALFTEKDGKLVGKTAAAGEIRLYAASSAATTAWWTREFVFFDGKIAYRGNGGDQERVAVEAGKTVTLDFNEGTATVE